MPLPPPPVYCANTPVSWLGTAELLLTTTLRLFARDWGTSDEPGTAWRGGLLAAGLPSWGMAAFNGLMGMIAIATRRPLDVRCVHCEVLGSDEGRLLQIVSLFQHSRGRFAEAALGDWLAPAARGRTGWCPRGCPG